MRDSRQITVLRSLFKTLHPTLTSGLKNGLLPAKRMFTGTRDKSPEERSDAISEPISEAISEPISEATSASSDTASNTTPSGEHAQQRTPMPPLPRTLTDEHLVAELESATRQFELQRAGLQEKSTGSISRKPAMPARGRRHFSRDTLLSLLEEAKVRIQVLETELELARGTEEHIPLLTEEWSDDLPSTFSRKPD